tara:strand:+ start:24272 stop:25231 length:960 start_codon:yes stop_codon:yes gene_type:complete
MNGSLKTVLLEHFNANAVQEAEVIQSIWSNYGTISRWQLVGADVNSVIVKCISVPLESNHPRGWNTPISHQRKVRSYEVEMAWYKELAAKTNSSCRTPKCYVSATLGAERVLVLEDLDSAGFEQRKSSLSAEEAKICLTWLAHFHATFMFAELVNLWPVGSYWHLGTRSDEWEVMEAGWLKTNAQKIDERLTACQFQTIIHGDAKLANFCFSTNMQAVAAVDFQYVGGGCGMKDVVYFLGSCLTEWECEKHEAELLDHYFKILKREVIDVDVKALEKEWRELYTIAWADFTRFLLGWMPTHGKLNSYSLQMVERAKEVV